MTVYVQAHVKSKAGVADTFQIIELMDEEEMI